MDVRVFSHTRACCLAVSSDSSSYGSKRKLRGGEMYVLDFGVLLTLNGAVKTVDGAVGRVLSVFGRGVEHTKKCHRIAL